MDIATTDRIVFEKFEDNEDLGGFILIDKVSNMTSACGVVEHALRRSDTVSFEKMDVTKEMRAEKKGQKPSHRINFPYSYRNTTLLLF